MKEGTNKFLVSVFVLLMSFFVVVAPFLCMKVNAQEGGSWTTLAPLPMRQSMYLVDAVYTGTAALNGKIYYIDLNMTLRYDPETNNWTELATLPIKNHWGTLVACQNKIYVIGGSFDVPTQVYDPATDTWANRASIPSTRLLNEANVVDGKIYIIGGQSPRLIEYFIDPSNSNDVYDTETDSWSQMAPIPIPVRSYVSAVLDGKIYIISGKTSNSNPYSNQNHLVQIFDPATNQWTNGTSIPIPVTGSGACATTGLYAPKRIYVLGGQLNQVYDPETDMWTNATAMPTPRSGFDPVVINDEIYAIGGGLEYITENTMYTPSDYNPVFPSIYIRADGSVEGTDKIQRDGDVYTLISDITGSIVVGYRDNVVLDGAGYRLQGDGNENGITLRISNNITVKNLELSGFNVGILVMASNQNKILNNAITDNFRGLDFTSAENNTVSGNNIANNVGGIAIENMYNSIIGNTITNNSDFGIRLYGAGYNSIIGNNITDNGRGISVSICYNNIIYHNNFVNNANHVETDDSNNIWDNGAHENKGNYWSDYQGIDITLDGIGDTPYIINENNQDNYPLLNPVPVIPEFPSWIILPLFLIVTVALTVYRRKLTGSS
jgi:parallel beta-helix repeat protein